MRKFKPKCLFSVCQLLVAGFIAVIVTPVQAVDLQTKFEQQIKAEKLSLNSFGIWVSNSKTGKIVDINGDKLMIPASLSKIVTAGTALTKFPPNFKLKTELLSTAKIDDEDLEGDIYYRSGGDPAVISESFWFLANELTRTGIKVIKGDLIIDISRFDEVLIDPNRNPERVDRAFDAPLCSSSFNWNSVNFYIRPGAKTGDPVQVIADPENDYIKVTNKAKTGGKEKAIEVERVEQAAPLKILSSESFVVKGELPVGHDEIVIYKSITQPLSWVGQNLKVFLAQRGIKLKGSIKKGLVPVNATVLAKMESKPVAQLVMDMNKFSNNYVAEMLTKNLAAEFKKQPATMEQGMEVIADFLKTVGIKNYKFLSPSGFSRHNQLRPSDLVKVLDYLANDMRVQPEFFASLPIAGVDGTMGKRLNNSKAQTYVRAKTGLLFNVVGLAGYAGESVSDRNTFAFIYNGTGREFQVRQLFDKLVEQLVVK